ncbi:hypothetical protein SXCC_02242 [Gluconacetobacter sp. SXCC-1]|nr:hypothetical protein SXCC_02242 [Gluconacetobacter sp. SXCC-1]
MSKIPHSSDAMGFSYVSAQTRKLQMPVMIRRFHHGTTMGRHEIPLPFPVPAF